jgi:two-component system, NtrC family, sensor histidine kinase HydH
MPSLPEPSLEQAAGVRHFVQAQDFAWLIFATVLLLTSPETNYDALILLPLIAVFQIVEPRLTLFSSPRGQVWSIVLKLIFSALLVGFTHGIDSYYYSIFLIPVVSAATTFSFGPVLLVTVLASAAYLSFLPLGIALWNFVPPEGFDSILVLRVSFFSIVSFVVFEQARAKRIEMQRTRDALERLVETQASLRRSERLAALGQLTAGLAHELRNPLGTIRASAEMLNKKAARDKPEVMSEMAGYIQSEVDRMNSLITSFLNFARPLQVHPAEADLRAVIADVFKQHAELARSRNVSLVDEVAANAAVFHFDADLMKVALSNLVQNAIQASAEGQQVKVEVTAAGSKVLLRVIDQGSGISPQHLENIFNPFFTTKAQGVGLGLAIVAKIVDEHRGAIQPISELGKGTTFEIALPTAA